MAFRRDELRVAGAEDRFFLKAGLRNPHRVSLGSPLLHNRSHPSRELLVGYATGALSLGPSLTVSVHLEACGECRQAVRGLEEAEGRLLASTPGVPLQPEALQRTLEIINTQLTNAERVQGIGPGTDSFPLPAVVAEIGLSPAVHLSADVWVAHLNAPRFGGWRTYVFCAPALTCLPIHGHLGDELIAVLEGSYHDGRDFGPGDFAETRPGSVHEMQVSASGRLVALISSGAAIDWRPADRALGALLDI